MNKKRGFTLIELLAVIVILAIIALIATPIIMNVIENSKKGAAERSAENYINAIETKIVTERMETGKFLSDGFYKVLSDGSLCSKNSCLEEEKIKIELSGTTVSSGYVLVINDVVNFVSNLKIGDYYYNKEEEKFILSEEAKEFSCKIENLNSGLIGTEISCGDEHFYVINGTEDSISMLAAENITLSTDNPVQSAEASNDNDYFVLFATSKYWTKSGFVYDSSSLLYDHIQSYENYLTSEIGININYATLLSYEQAKSLTVVSEEDYSVGPDWLYDRYFWLGTATGNYIWSIGEKDIYDLPGTTEDMGLVSGIRPVINVPISEIG